MDLESGNCLWTELSPDVRGYPKLSEDLRCDVAIVGAGITGAIIASSLVDHGVDVVVLDRRQPGRGSTAACTALVLYEIDVPLIELAQRLGREHARGAYRACRRALDDLAQIIARHHIDCDLHRRESLFLARNDDDMRWFAQEVEARRQIGIDADLIGEVDLRDRFNILRPGGILSSAAMVVDPYRLTLGLVDAAIARGAKVFSDTSVDLKYSTSGRHLLTCQGGPRVECDHVVIATGYETPEQFRSIRELCSIRSTYVLASKKLHQPPPWPDSALLWEAGDPYLYTRQSNGRVIIGGEDEPIVDATQRDALLASKVRQLLRKFESICPHNGIEPEFTWAGTFTQTADGLPFIGASEKWPRCLFALGYGGNGITYTTLAAQILTDAILGRRNSDADLFRFDR